SSVPASAAFVDRSAALFVVFAAFFAAAFPEPAFFAVADSAVAVSADFFAAFVAFFAAFVAFFADLVAAFFAAAFPAPAGASGSSASAGAAGGRERSEEHTSELQSREKIVCRLLLEKKKT